MGALEHVAIEALWSLDGMQARAIEGGAHDAIGVHILDGVDDTQGRDHSLRAGAHRCGNAVHNLRRDEGAGCIVHQDDVDLGGQCKQCPGDRVLPGLSARHDDDRELDAGEKGARLLRSVFRNGDDDDVDIARCSEVAHGVKQDRLARQGAQGLGGPWTQALAASRSGDDHRSEGGVAHGDLRFHWHGPRTRLVTT